jgi:glutamate transport system substrate-binding protein
VSFSPRSGRRFTAATASLLALTVALTAAACSSPPKGNSGSPRTGHNAPDSAAFTGAGNISALNALIAAEKPASAQVIAADSVAAKIKARGTLIVGGVETAPLFSLLNPATGQLSGFDADLSQLLAKYIIGANHIHLVTVTAATREALLENHSVDTVFATYTITPAREKLVGFAGPYFTDGLGIAIRKGTAGITSAASLSGKTYVTQSGSTIPDAVSAIAPKAHVLLFDTDTECVQALLQGRASAYVLDQGILAGDALHNPGMTVLASTFDQEPYGIGVPLDEPQFKAFINTWLQGLEADGTWTKLWKDTIGTAIGGPAPTPPTVG